LEEDIKENQMKKKWVSSDGWRGAYVPVPPAGFEMLMDCQVVNKDPEKLRDLVAGWLRSKRIKYKSGYMSTSNVFSASLYMIVEQGKLSNELKKAIDNWFVDWANSTFSIFSGTEKPLDFDSAKREFYEIVARYPLGSQSQFNPIRNPYYPDGWSERHEESIGVPLPDGAKFFSTPGHGFLQVDTRKLPARISKYDYHPTTNIVLLEEDCSMSMWLAEMGLIPRTAAIKKWIREIPRNRV
jgi:hypothetical protein